MADIEQINDLVDQHWSNHDKEGQGSTDLIDSNELIGAILDELGLRDKVNEKDIDECFEQFQNDERVSREDMVTLIQILVEKAQKPNKKYLEQFQKNIEQLKEYGCEDKDIIDLLFSFDFNHDIISDQFNSLAADKKEKKKENEDSNEEQAADDKKKKLKMSKLAKFIEEIE